METEGISLIGKHIYIGNTYLDDMYTYNLIVMGIIPTLIWFGFMVKSAYEAARNKCWELVVVILATFAKLNDERPLDKNEE